MQLSQLIPRARKQSEQDLCDTNEQLADVSCQNQGLSSSKRKLESDLADLKVKYFRVMRIIISLFEYM